MTAHQIPGGMDARYAMPPFPYGTASFPRESRQVFSGMGFGISVPPDWLRLSLALATGLALGWWGHQQWKRWSR